MQLKKENNVVDTNKNPYFRKKQKNEETLLVADSCLSSVML